MKIWWLCFPLCLRLDRRVQKKCQQNSPNLGRFSLVKPCTEATLTVESPEQLTLPIVFWEQSSTNPQAVIFIHRERSSISNDHKEIPKREGECQYGILSRCQLDRERGRERTGTCNSQQAEGGGSVSFEGGPRARSLSSRMYLCHAGC